MCRPFHFIFVMTLCLVGCQTRTIQTEETAATLGDASPAKQTTETIRPAIGTATPRQDCLYYTSTSDGKMAIGGSVKMGKILRVTARSADGWTQVRLSNGRKASIPTEDLTTLKQFRRDRSRARAARRSKFADPRPKITPGRDLRQRRKLPTAPPPPDFVPPPLPDTPLDDPLSNMPDILLEGNE